MAYETRSLGQLSTEARAYFAGAVEGAVVSVWPNTFTVEAKVLAMLSREHEDRRAYLYRQIFRSTADAAWLQRHGYEDGLALTAGLPASGLMTIAATLGTVVPAGTRFKRPDGITYSTTAAVTASGASVSLPIEADEIGMLGNTPATTALTLTSDSVAPVGLATLGVVGGGGLTGGSDDENREAYRARVMNRRQRPPAGGNRGDYERWVVEALGRSIVKAVYVEAFTSDPCAVWLEFTVTDQANGIPSAGQVATVQAYVNDPVRKPICARPFASAPTPSAVPVTIGGLSPDTPQIRSAIGAEMAAFFFDSAEPGKPSAPYRLRVEAVRGAVRRGAGTGTFSLVAPSADTNYPAGVMPVLGAITYV